jgi:hypothetical protein
MGIVIRYQEKHEVIPVVQNLADLEINITSLIKKLSRTKLRTTSRRSNAVSVI